MGCTPIPKFRYIGRVTGKRRPGQTETGKEKCASEPSSVVSPFPTKFDVFRRCDIPDPLRSHPPFAESSVLEGPKNFTQDLDTAEPEQATYEAYSAAFHAGSNPDKQERKEDHTNDSSDSQSFWLSSSSSSSSSAHLPSSSSSSSITLSSPSTLHPHYVSPTGLSTLNRIRTHLCLPLDLPPSHLIVHLIRRWERARVAVAQKNAELAAQANALDWSGVEDEEAAEFLTYEEMDVLNTWAEAQKDMEKRRLCPLFGAWGYTESAK